VQLLITEGILCDQEKQRVLTNTILRDQTLSSCERVSKTLPLLVLIEKAHGLEELSLLFETWYNVQSPKGE